MLKAFTRYYDDYSTETGFQFTFYCDLCLEEYKTVYTPYKKSLILRKLSGRARTIRNYIRSRLKKAKCNVGSGYILTDKFYGMSSSWHKQHNDAFELAQIEARQHFNRCNTCKLWVCDTDFNEVEGLCAKCAPKNKMSSLYTLLTSNKNQTDNRIIEEIK